jgi:hypothetical protein
MYNSGYSINAVVLLLIGCLTKERLFLFLSDILSPVVIQLHAWFERIPLLFAHYCYVKSSRQTNTLAVQ